MSTNLSPLWISVKTAFLATIITFILGVSAAYWIANSKNKFKGLIDGLFTLPLILFTLIPCLVKTLQSIELLSFKKDFNKWNELYRLFIRKRNKYNEQNSK